MQASHPARSFGAFGLPLISIALTAIALAPCVRLHGGTFPRRHGQEPGGLADGQQDIEAARPVFAFHSGFWINLHHVLYQQARLRQQRPTSRGGGAATTDGAVGKGRERTALDAPNWNAAINFYDDSMAARDLLFDSRMVEINDRLAQFEICEDLSGRDDPDCASGLDHDLLQMLERAAPIYRERWWPEDDRANRTWIAGVAPLVRQSGKPLADQLAAVYHAQWPRNPIRVDVVSYGGPFGAYTTLEPLHITMSSSDPRNQGLAGFEILFHEASHALAGAVQEAIVRDCRAANKPIPRDLWHALLFYTTGELVKRLFEKTSAPGAASYTPYAVRNRLYSRGWQDYERDLERSWQPYLDGKTNFDHALEQLVAGL